MSPLPASEPLRALLQRLPGRHPPGQIDTLWIFPPQVTATRETGLIVLSLYDPAGPQVERRELVTVRYQHPGDPAGPETVQHHGWAPPERFPRVISGVLSRLEDQSAEEPLEFVVAGQPERWPELLQSVGGMAVDPANGE